MSYYLDVIHFGGCLPLACCFCCVLCLVFCLLILLLSCSACVGVLSLTNPDLILLKALSSSCLKQPVKLIESVLIRSSNSSSVILVYVYVILSLFSWRAHIN